MIAVVGISGVLDKSLSKTVEAAKQKISGINPKAIKAAAAVAGIATASFKVGKELASLGTEYQKSMNQLQASTGATKKDMQGLGEVVKNIYGNNFGESIQDVADRVAEVKKSTDLSGKSLQKVTEGALTLRDTFDYDVFESARAAKAMMTNFGIDGEKALSMIAAGAQNGLDFSGELLDSISEYSVQFAKVGLSADDMFNIFQQGADSGAWNLDKVGDAVKEFSIRAIDGSDSTIGAFEKLGLNSDKLMKKFAEGGPEANKSFNMVLKKLMDVDDKVKRDAIGVALFGTQWEDLGTDVMQALANTENKAYDANGALKKIEEVKYNDLGSAMEGIGRVIEVALLPAAAAVAKKLTELKPTIQKAVESAIEKVKSLKPVMQEMQPVVEKVLKSIGKQIQALWPVIESIAKFAANNIDKLTPILAALGTAIAGLKFARLASEVVGYAKAIKGATSAAKLLLTTKIKDKAETIILHAMCAKDVAVRGASAAATKAQALATNLFSKEKMAERLQLLQTQALHIKDAAAKGISTAATVAQTTATTVWQAVSRGAAIATKALGVAFRFMTGPIGIAIAVITAIIAAGVLLYKNWDTVKAKAIAFAGKIKSVFSGMKNSVIAAFSSMRTKIGNAFAGLAALVKSPINAVISVVNKAISGINSVGGVVGISVSKIPMLATGGLTDGPSIAGEGKYNEYVITPDPRYRAANIEYWQQAGRALGMDDTSYSLGSSTSVNINMGGIEYNPTIEIYGNASKEDVLTALREDREEFMDMLEEWQAERMEYAYGY